MLDGGQFESHGWLEWNAVALVASSSHRRFLNAVDAVRYDELTGWSTLVCGIREYVFTKLIACLVGPRAVYDWSTYIIFPLSSPSTHCLAIIYHVCLRRSTRRGAAVARLCLWPAVSMAASTLAHPTSQACQACECAGHSHPGPNGWTILRSFVSKFFEE